MLFDKESGFFNLVLCDSVTEMSTNEVYNKDIKTKQQRRIHHESINYNKRKF